MARIAVTKIPCSNFDCNKELPPEKMVHIDGGYYCSLECWTAQLVAATRQTTCARAKGAHSDKT